ncbi:hypothetical protein BGZ65_004566, partial [Modicella reniformis]
DGGGTQQRCGRSSYDDRPHPPLSKTPSQEPDYLPFAKKPTAPFQTILSLFKKKDSIKIIGNADLNKPLEDRVELGVRSCKGSMKEK